jgi:hypothetical protein
MTGVGDGREHELAVALLDAVPHDRVGNGYGEAVLVEVQAGRVREVRHPDAVGDLIVENATGGCPQDFRRIHNSHARSTLSPSTVASTAVENVERRVRPAMMNVRLCWETTRSRAANPITSLFWFNLGRRRRSSGAGLAVAQLPRVRSCPYHSWYPCRGDHRLDNAARSVAATQVDATTVGDDSPQRTDRDPCRRTP